MLQDEPGAGGLGHTPVVVDRHRLPTIGPRIADQRAPVLVLHQIRVRLPGGRLSVRDRHAHRPGPVTLFVIPRAAGIEHQPGRVERGRIEQS